ncbi:Uncharacterised protein [Legionella oakridgensis]|nr:Uncharacterised protein [Legionella oakridgensis]
MLFLSVVISVPIATDNTLAVSRIPEPFRAISTIRSLTL